MQGDSLFLGKISISASPAAASQLLIPLTSVIADHFF